MGQRRNHPTHGKGAHLMVHTPTGDARMDADQNIVIGHKDEQPPDGQREAGKPMGGTQQEAPAARRKTG